MKKPIGLCFVVMALFLIVGCTKSGQSKSGNNTNSIGDVAITNMEVNTATNEVLTNITDSYSPADLFKAMNEGDYENIHTIIDSGVDIKTTDENGNTPLHIAASDMELCMNLAETFLDKGANINSKNHTGDTPLHKLVKNMDVSGVEDEVSAEYKKLFELFIKNNADINAKNNNGTTPFHLVAASQYLPFVKYFVDNNADIGAKDNTGDTAERYAVKNCNGEYCEVEEYLVGLQE